MCKDFTLFGVLYGSAAAVRRLAETSVVRPQENRVVDNPVDVEPSSKIVEEPVHVDLLAPASCLPSCDMSCRCPAPMRLCGSPGQVELISAAQRTGQRLPGPRESKCRESQGPQTRNPQSIVISSLDSLRKYGSLEASESPSRRGVRVRVRADEGHCGGPGGPPHLVRGAAILKRT